MAAKVIILFCAQALLIQSAFSQCTSRASVDASNIPYNTGFGIDGFSGYNGLGYPGLVGRGLIDNAAIDASTIAFNNGFRVDGIPGCNGLGYPGWAGRGLIDNGLYSPAMEFTATSGGALPVTSSSSSAPVGISIVSDNMFEGALSVAGQLPFVGTTGVEGVLPTSGAGAINHGCGNGVNIMSALSATSSPASVVTDVNPGNLAYQGALASEGLYTNRITPGFAPTALGYDGVYGNQIAPGFAAPAFACDGLYGNRITPELVTPALSYTDAILNGRACNGLGYNSAVDTIYSPAIDALGYPAAAEALEFTPTSGGALPVASSSAIPPTGIAVSSDNAYEGTLEVIGELPFVGTVAMEGVVPSAGAGAVNHACGNGRTAMASGSAAYAPAAALAPLAAYGPAGAIAPAAFGAYGAAPGFAGEASFTYPGRFGCGF